MSARVVLLDQNLDEWIDTGADEDWLRLVGGGPGSGKSTTLKALARRYADRAEWRPLFVPLQHIGIDTDLRDSINRHFADRSDGSFTQPPLSRTALEDGPPLLLIFDGLDELVAPNDSANEVINTFTARLNGLVAALRGDGSRRIKVVVSGRMPAFQAARRFLAPPREGCLEAFGYLPVDSRDFVDSEPLWAVDQRPEWWARYAAALGAARETPPALCAEELEGITHEPLLCYLLVLAGYATNDWEKAAENKNRIYETLMTNIYDRGWGDGIRKRHGAGKSMSLSDFLLLMETIGLAAWLGGDARVATEASFNATLRVTGAERAWATFKDDNGPDVTNLAMNFYLKAAEGNQRGFEFTHKSFGEYLAAKSLLAVAYSIYDLVPRRTEHAMRDWSDATKSGIITLEILEFMRNEVRLDLARSPQNFSKVINVKTAFQEIANTAMTHGFAFGTSTNWRAQEALQNSAEFATWAVMSACSRGLANSGHVNEAMIDIKWLNSFSLRELTARLNGSYGWGTCFLTCLSYVRAQGAFMHGTALHGADFTGADLSYAVFDSSKLFGAVFRNADLRLISFYNSIITESVFDGAKLSRSTIVGCVLRNIDLSSADIDIMRTTVDTIYNSDKGAFHNIPGLRIIRESAHTAIPYLDDYESATAFVESLPSAINSDYNRTEPEGGRNP